MDDDSRALDKGWDALPGYSSGPGDADEAVTVSVSTAPGEWLVNTVDSVVVPMSMVEVVEALRTHKLTDRSLVWRTGMQEWQPVDRVPQLKLAARMPSMAPVAPLLSSRPPPPKSSRGTTAPRGTAAQSASPLPMPSRRATLPGLPPPSKSRPSNPRLAAARPTLPPPARSDESDVLAVYARPAATISFEIAPEPPPQSSAPALHAPHTLAPLTTDTAPRRPLPARNADLSVVAASQFRDVQRSSKRLVWASSLGSAAAASLLTLWLSSSPSPPRSAVAAAPAAPASVEALTNTPAAPKAAPVTEPVPSTVAEATTPPPVEPAPAKPKVKVRRKARAAVARPAPATASAAGAVQDPNLEPNPYDVKLEEDPPPAIKTAPAEGSALEATSAASEAKPTSDSSLPGF